MTGLTPKQLKTYNRLHYLKNRDRILKRAKLKYSNKTTPTLYKKIKNTLLKTLKQNYDTQK